jgi:hypothetical protein
LQNYVYEEAESLNDYLILSTSFNDAEVTLAEGIYYIEFDAGSDTFYGEYFQVLDSMVNITCGTHIELKWSNTCLHYSGEFYSSSDDEVFVDRFIIPYTDAQIETNYEYAEEGIENGRGQFTAVFKQQIKKYRIKFLVPHYAVGALNFMQLCESVVYYDNLQFVDYGIQNLDVSISENFDDVCFQVCEISFELGVDRGRSVYNNSQCCDEDVYTGTIVDDFVNNECEIFIRGGCDFDAKIVLVRTAGANPDDLIYQLRADAYDKGTTDDFTPSGTLTYTWYYANNDDCTCASTGDTTRTITIRDDTDTPAYDNKGKYIVIVEDDGTNCRMSAQLNYEANCRGGDPIYEPDDPDCEAYDVDIAYDSDNGQLTATPFNEPAGQTTTYKWYYTTNGTTSLLSDTSQTISLGANYGEYQVVASAGNCTASTTHTYSDACLNFTATKSISGDSITYNAPSGFSPTYSWVYIDTSGTRSALPTTVVTHVAQNTGFYEFTMTDGDCTYVDTTYLTIEDCTGKSASISKSGNTLTASATGFGGSETYEWYKDTGSGEATTGETGLSYEVTETGNYIVKVTEGACTVEENKVVIYISDCCDLTASIALNGAVLEATVTGCDDDTEEIRWYYWNGSNFVYVDIGETHTPSSYGIYKIRVTCGDCDIVESFYDYND